MFRSKLILVFWLIALNFSPDALTRPIADNDKNNALAYIEYAISLQKTNFPEASKALNKAYYLANKQNNLELTTRVFIEQAQLAKIQKDYYLAQQLLRKAESKIASVDDRSLSVQIYTNMSTIQRYLKKFDLSIEYAQKSLKLAKELKNPKLIFRSLKIKGAILKDFKRYEEAAAALLSAKRFISSIDAQAEYKLYRDIADVYNKLNENRSAIRYYNKALKVLGTQNNTIDISKTLLELAKTEAKIGLMPEALKSIKTSIALAKDNQNEKVTLQALTFASVVYRKLSRYEQALNYATDAISIYRLNKDSDGIAVAANSIGLIYTHLNQLDNAKSYFEEVISLPTDEVRAKLRAAALRELGKLESDNDPVEALNLLNQAYEIYEILGNVNGIASVLKNIGKAHFKMGELDDAEHAFDSAVALAEKTNDVWNAISAKTSLAKVLISTDTTRAIDIATQSLNQAQQIGAKSLVENAFSALIEAEEQRGQYQVALNYAKQKEQVVKEIKTDSINKRLAEMHVILDVEKKESQLEVLKKQKEVITLELDNKQKRLSLLEKEQQIELLEKQNSFIVLTAICTFIMLGVYIIGRLYFQINYKFMLIILLILSTGLATFNSFGKDVIKVSKSGSKMDIRSNYTHEILNTALEKSRPKYGDYEVQTSDMPLNNLEKILEVREGDILNLTMAMSSTDWEYLATPIRIPIRRGISNYRLLAVNKNRLSAFEGVTTLNHLKALKVGAQEHWILTDVLEENGFNIVKSSTYEGIFRMLNKGRFDYVPRAIHEVYQELELRKDVLSDIVIEPNIVLYVPQVYYIFVSPKFPRIKERIEHGLEIMISKGLLKTIFDQYYGQYIEMADLANRTVIHIESEMTTKSQQANHKELWSKYSKK